MLSIKLKLALKLRDTIGKEYGDYILEAMKEDETKKLISQMIQDKKLFIVDSHNKAIYEKEISELINKSFSAKSTELVSKF